MLFFEKRADRYCAKTYDCYDIMRADGNGIGVVVSKSLLFQNCKYSRYNVHELSEIFEFMSSLGAIPPWGHLTFRHEKGVEQERYDVLEGSYGMGEIDCKSRLFCCDKYVDYSPGHVRQIVQFMQEMGSASRIDWRKAGF